jgi:hypothetical protein
VKLKKWAKKARTIAVHLEDPRGIHLVEIRDAKKQIIRTRTLEYHDPLPTLSMVMSDVQVRLAINGLIVEENSYRLTNEGRVLLAAVSTSESARRRST